MAEKPARDFDLIFYLLRFFLSAFLFAFLIKVFHQKEIVDLGYSGNVALAFCSLDVFRNLFYGLLILGACLLFAPSRAFEKMPGALRLFFAIFFGVVCFWPVVFLLRESRAGYELHWSIFALALLAGLNGLLFVLHQSPRLKNSEFVEKSIRRGVVLVDVLFPLLVWQEYGKNRSWSFRLLRILPVLVFMGGLFSLTLFHLPNRYSDPRLSFTYDRLKSDPMDSFFMETTKNEDTLFVSKRIYLDRVSLKKEETSPKVTIPARPREGRGMVAFALSPDEKQIYAMGIEDGMPRLLFIDAKTMEISKQADLEFPHGEKLCRASLFTHPGQNGILTIFDSGYYSKDGGALFQVDNEMETINRFVFCGNPYDAVVDTARRLIYVLYYSPGMVAAYDVDTLELVSHAFVPEAGNQVVMDEKNDRLYIAFPVEGVIRVLNLKTFQIEKTIRTIIGVRALCVLPEQNLLLAGGYTPYVEVFDLGSLNLENRFISLTWTRNIMYAPKNQFVYFSGFNGVARVLAEDISSLKKMTFFEKHDPFFIFMRAGLDFVLEGLKEKPPVGTEGQIDDCFRVEQ